MTTNVSTIAWCFFTYTESRGEDIYRLTNPEYKVENKTCSIDTSDITMPYKEKDLVAKLIGRINWQYRDQNKHMMLIVPGRVGTSSPELGVPTAFSDISAYEIICETEETKAGYNPELSYGSHIFQDLVEAEILYTAVFHNEKTVHFSPEKLVPSKDLVAEFEQGDLLKEIVPEL